MGEWKTVRVVTLNEAEIMWDLILAASDWIIWKD